MGIKVVFYKDNYRYWSRLIKFWTKSNYSHCEFYVDGALWGISEEQKVRKKKQELNRDKWDVFELKDSSKLARNLKDFYHKTQGAKYDWKGILLAQVFNLRRDNKNKYTCSEWVMEVLDKTYNLVRKKNYVEYTPQDVYDVLSFYELI